MNTRECPGPLIWYDAPGPTPETGAALLACSGCTYIIVTGNLHDPAHYRTPIQREEAAA